MLAFKYRFHGHGSLRYVYKNGAAFRSRFFILKNVFNSRRKLPRVAVVVSKKIYKSAVKRNLIRRRIYEIIRQEIPKLSPQHDLVIIVSSPEILALDQATLKKSLRDALYKSNLYFSAQK